MLTSIQIHIIVYQKKKTRFLVNIKVIFVYLHNKFINLFFVITNYASHTCTYNMCDIISKINFM